MLPTRPARLVSPTTILLLVIAAAALPSSAQSGGTGKTGDQPTTLRGHADLQVDKIQNQLRNARSRLNNGVVGMGSGAEAAPTLGQQCCGKNAERISRLTVQLSAILDGLESCYARTDVVGQETNLQYVRQDIDRIRNGIEPLTQAASGGDASGRLADITRAFFGLKKDVAPLPDCGGPGAAKRVVAGGQ